MTARTLEEIEAEVKRDSPGVRLSIILEDHAPRLLEIAQEQRAKLERARQDINWMLNSKRFLNPDVFDYL
jgi:hypothetical protein